MHRFYLPPEQCQGAILCLTEGEAHHAQHVLRVGRGERVVVLDGAGQEYECEVQEPARATVPLAVLEKRTHPPLAYRLTLLQAIPRGKLMDSIVQKATELGAWRVVPLLTERVVTQLAPEDAARKAEKWRVTALEAIKQCGSAWLPHVETPLTPAQFLSRPEEACELPLLASLQSDRRHPRAYFQDFRTQHGRPPRGVSVWVGPEGDFTPAEITAIRGAGARPITLGPLVLRSETAALYCLSVLNYELQAPA